MVQHRSLNHKLEGRYSREFSLILLPYLGLDLVSFGLTGWSLSLTNVILFCGIFLIVLNLVLAVINAPWLHGLLGYIPQTLAIVLGISLLVTLTLTVPKLLFLLWLPGLTTLLFWQELLFRYHSYLNTSITLIGVGLLGLGCGELVDILLIPSQRL